jgi:hypothetical protein
MSCINLDIQSLIQCQYPNQDKKPPVLAIDLELFIPIYSLQNLSISKLLSYYSFYVRIFNYASMESVFATLERYLAFSRASFKFLTL